MYNVPRLCKRWVRLPLEVGGSRSRAYANPCMGMSGYEIIDSVRYAGIRGVGSAAWDADFLLKLTSRSQVSRSLVRSS